VGWLELRAAIWGHGIKLGVGVDRAGRALDWILDSREVLLDSHHLRSAARLMWRIVRWHTPDLVGGLTMAADPLTFGVLLEADAEGHRVGGFSIRSAAKPHGLRKLVEGQAIRPGARVVLVDDVLSSGRSLARAHDIVTSAGAEVVAAVVLVDFQRPHASGFARLGLPVDSVYTLADLGLATRPPSLPGLARPVRRRPAGPSRRSAALHSAVHDSGVVVTAAASRRGRGRLSALRRDTGIELWRIELTARPTTPPALAGDGQLVVGLSDGRLVSVRTADGRLVWSRQVANGKVTGAPLATAGLVVVGGNHLVVALDPATGQTRWIAPMAGRVVGGVAPAGDSTVTTGSLRGDVALLEPASGRVLWTYQTGGPIRHVPSYSGGRLTVLCEDGYVYDFDVNIAPSANRQASGVSRPTS